MIRSLRVLGVLGAAALAGAGCTGAIDPSARPGTGTGSSSSGTGPSTGSGNGNGGNIPTPGTDNPGLKPPTGDTTVGMLDDSKSEPGAAPLRRLTLFEYQNTVRDLLGVTPDVAAIKDSSDQDSAQSGFLRGGPLTTPADARAFSTSADAIASAAQGKLATLLPCSPVPTGAGEQEACVGEFIGKFGLRAFRRPVSGQEADRLKTLYKSLRGEAGLPFERAVGLMVSAILQSPGFLYHWELGPNAPIKDGNLVRFNSYEVASRLSYMLWGTMPDDKLFIAAAEGKLVSPEQISGEARRMLTDPKALDAVANFHSQWLEIEGVEDMPKNPEYKDYTKEVAKAMALETREFVKNVFFGPQATGKIETLFTSNKGYVNAGLAKIYGVTGATGGDMKEVTLDPAQRAGIFTQGSYLVTKADADDSHPVKRGDTLLKRVLCTELTPPPGAQIPPVADPSPDKTTRERFAEHSTNASCAGCHALIDPPGFAFENYDSIGAYRTMENGKPIDASGTFTIPGGAEVKFKNAIELVQALAKAPQVQDCMVKQWLRYAVRRHETNGEKPSLDALAETFKTKSYDMRELVVAVTKTRSFTHRKLSDGEVAQ